MNVLDDMRQAAGLAGELLLRRRSGLASLQVESKGVKDFVTSVDREAEEIIAGYLEERWPGIPFLAEESDARKTDAAERWIVDPLDGTTNYIHGFPVFCVSIAFQSAGRLQAGVVLDPTRGELFCAEQGKGATLDGAPLSVSGAGDLGASLLATGFPFREIERLDGYLADFRRLLTASAGVRRAGSAAMDLCYVAAGRCDGFWEIGLSPWDVAAGGLMVLEAGGLVTDFSGGDEWLSGREIVAATPGIQTAILEALGRTAD
jgi:myo-inositol-1(or 4)-monophosphatase